MEAPPRRNNFPDEKGIETNGPATRTTPGMMRSIFGRNNFPDEKGIETLNPVANLAKSSMDGLCRNNFPDEKGIETQLLCRFRLSRRQLTLA